MTPQERCPRCNSYIDFDEGWGMCLECGWGAVEPREVPDEDYYPHPKSPIGPWRDDADRD